MARILSIVFLVLAMVAVTFATKLARTEKLQLYRLQVDGAKGCAGEKLDLVCHAPKADTFKNINSNRIAKVSYLRGGNNVVNVRLDSISQKQQSSAALGK